jgi:hypothetical protein
MRTQPPRPPRASRSPAGGATGARAQTRDRRLAAKRKQKEIRRLKLPVSSGSREFVFFLMLLAVPFLLAILIFLVLGE